MGLSEEVVVRLCWIADSFEGFWSQCYESYCLISETFRISNTPGRNCSGTITALLKIQVENIVWSLLKVVHRVTKHYHCITLRLINTFCRLVGIAPFHFRDKDQHVALPSTTNKTFKASKDPGFRALTKAYCRPTQLSRILGFPASPPNSSFQWIGNSRCF